MENDYFITSIWSIMSFRHNLQKNNKYMTIYSKIQHLTNRKSTKQNLFGVDVLIMGNEQTNEIFSLQTQTSLCTTLPPAQSNPRETVGTRCTYHSLIAGTIVLSGFRLPPLHHCNTALQPQGYQSVVSMGVVNYMSIHYRLWLT